MKLSLIGTERARKMATHGADLIWTSCEPFVENSRARLVHRPASVVRYNLHRHPHLAITYLCGNGATGSQKFTFLATPPDGSVVCARCEMAAIEAGLPSSTDLAGHHVCLGELRVVNLCHGSSETLRESKP